MTFGIIRIQKHNSMSSAKRSGMHKDRERDTPNADPDRTALNVTEGAQTSDELVKAIQDRVDLATVKATGDDKPVLAVEYLITASPEFFKEKSAVEVDRYFEDAKNWLKAKHGAANVVSITRHNDEKSPHLSAFVVPLVEREAGTRKRSVIVGKDATGHVIRETREFKKPAEVALSAKHYFGGTKATLSELQSEFAEEVCSKHGLRRGIRGSKAKHQRVSRFYALIEKPVKNVTIDPDELKKVVFTRMLGMPREQETPLGIAERLTQKARDFYEPAVERAKIAEFEHARARQMAEVARRAQSRVTELEAEKKALIKAITDNGPELERLRATFSRGQSKPQLKPKTR